MTSRTSGSAEQRVRLQQVQRPLARLDPADRQHVPAPLRPTGRRRGEPVVVDAVGDDRRVDAPAVPDLGGDRGGHADVRVRPDDRAFVAGRQFRRGEGVEVVDRPDAAVDGVRADAVLRVHDVVAVRGERRPQHRDRPQDPLADALVRDVREGHDRQPHPRVDRPEEPGVAAAAERPHRDVLARARPGPRPGRACARPRRAVSSSSSAGRCASGLPVDRRVSVRPGGAARGGRWRAPARRPARRPRSRPWTRCARGSRRRARRPWPGRGTACRPSRRSGWTRRARPGSPPPAPGRRGRTAGTAGPAPSAARGW